MLPGGAEYLGEPVRVLVPDLLDAGDPGVPRVRQRLESFLDREMLQGGVGVDRDEDIGARVGREHPRLRKFLAHIPRQPLPSHQCRAVGACPVGAQPRIIAGLAVLDHVYALRWAAGVHQRPDAPVQQHRVLVVDGDGHGDLERAEESLLAGGDREGPVSPPDEQRQRRHRDAAAQIGSSGRYAAWARTQAK